MDTRNISAECLSRLGNEVRQTTHHLTGWMELAAGESDPDARSQYINDCRDAADRLVRVAEDLEELASSDRATASEPFLFKESMTELSDLMADIAGQHGISLQTSIAPAVPASVVGDASLLQDTLRRLIDNAIRFSGSEPLKLSIAAVSTESENVRVTFEISDSGPGIPDEVVSDLNVPVNAPRLQGLGLRVVAKRVAESGGTLSIRRGAPRGTLIEMSLPFPLATNVRAREQALNGDRPAATPLNMLVAEDSDDSYCLLESFTKSSGHRISRASNGAEAVEMIKRGSYDLVLMDVNMPTMDGYTATKLIRQWETERARTRLPIVLLSADALEKQMRVGGAVGCSGYLTKPATKAQVLAAIDYYSQHSIPLAPHSPA